MKDWVDALCEPKKKKKINLYIYQNSNAYRVTQSSRDGFNIEVLRTNSY